MDDALARALPLCQIIIYPGAIGQLACGQRPEGKEIMSLFSIMVKSTIARDMKCRVRLGPLP